MKKTLKEFGFAAFFLIVIALVAVEAAEAGERPGNETALQAAKQ